MADMPTCKKCGTPHWRFTPCDRIPQAPPVRPMVRVPERPAPDGYVRVGPNKFARADPDAPRPNYVQIAPGKFRKVTQ